MLRTRLTMAACAAALLGAPALAQETQPTQPDTPPQTTTPATPTNPADPPVEPTVTPTPEPTAAEGQDDGDAATDAAATLAEGGDVLAVLRGRGQFSTLIAGLEATGLDEVITNDPDITILAPTDAAFAALPAGELDRLMQPANVDELRQLLLFHVINADVRSEQVLNRRGAVQTGAGSEVMIDGGGGTIRVGEATVTEADVRGSNGAVFVLDQVLSPGGATDDEAAPAGTPGEVDSTPPGTEAGDDADDGAPMPTQPTEVPAQDAPTSPPPPATPPVETPDVGDEEETVPEA